MNRKPPWSHIVPSPNLQQSRFDYLLLVGTHVKEEVAYKAVKALYGNKKQLVAGHGVYRGFAPKLMGKKGIGVDYHPGSVRFYREVGIW